MWIVTYKGIFITKSLNKPDNLKHLLIYKGSSKLIRGVYFHEEFEEGWNDILYNENIKETISIYVFKNYIGPKFQFYDSNYISIWNKSENIDGISTNIKIFFNNSFKFKEQIKKYMNDLGFIFYYESSDRLVYNYNLNKQHNIFSIL